METVCCDEMARAAREDTVSTYVYRIYDGDTDELLYIGSATNPRRRYSSHRHRDWWPAHPKAKLTEYPDRATAYAAEDEAIARERPPHNINRVPPDPAVMEALIDQIAAAAPPLTDDQRNRISALLRTGSRGRDV